MSARSCMEIVDLAPEPGDPPGGSRLTGGPALHVVQLSVENFRGIETLTWQPSRGINCLIGPGNSRKSTIVEAIALLFTPRRSVPFSDADFCECDTNKPIGISAVVAGLPPELDNFETFGQLQCGWNAEAGEIHDDPLDDDERALSVRLTVDESLEPLWEAYKPGEDGETRPFRAGTREKLGVFRVEERPDHHLRWSRGSALSGLGADDGAINEALTDAHRIARQAVFDAPLENLKATAANVSTAAGDLGASHFAAMRPGLDPRGMSSGGALVLHDGVVPLTSEGLGVRRLTSIAIQKLRAQEHSIFLVDEIEHGLEPHRLLRILRTLRDRAGAGDQMFATTHSPTVVAALDATQLVIVRSNDGTIDAHAVPGALAGLKVTEPQGTVRSGPEAMLANRVLVVEGATEEGFARECTSRWDTAEVSLALLGTAVRMGGSDEQALERATCLAELGFDAGAMLDRDSEWADEVATAEAAGVTVLRSPQGLDLEHHVVRDLPDDLLKPLIDLAVEIRAEAIDDEEAKTSIYAQIRDRLAEGDDAVGDDPLGWVTEDRTIGDVRKVIADSAAAKPPWFKTQAAAAKLAALVLDNEEAVRAQGGDENFAEYLDELKAFLYGAGDGEPGAGHAAAL